MGPFSMVIERGHNESFGGFESIKMGTVWHQTMSKFRIKSSRVISKVLRCH